MLVETDGGVIVITINRPEARNAINRAASEAIAAAIDRLDADASLSVGILTGAGGHFCAGMDLKAFLQGERVELEGRGLAGLVERPPHKPLIAAVEGYALAGGFEIALACDLIVAAENGAVRHSRRFAAGLIAGSGGLLRLPQKMPRADRDGICADGPHDEGRRGAGQWGLVNRLVAPGGAARRRARHWPPRSRPTGRFAVAMTKKVIDEAPTWPAAEIWPRQKEILERVIASERRARRRARFR